MAIDCVVPYFASVRGRGKVYIVSSNVCGCVLCCGTSQELEAEVILQREQVKAAEMKFSKTEEALRRCQEEALRRDSARYED